MQRLPDEIVRSHAHLTSLEQELGKQRDSLIREYQRGGATSTQQLYGSFYPMLERLNHLQQQYAAELNKFKTGLQQAVDPNQSSTNDVNAQVQQQAPVNVNNNINTQQTQQQQTVITNPNNNIVTNNSQSRKIANMNQNNGNNYNGINGINDDAKQSDNTVVNPSQTVQQQASTENEMKVSVDTLYQGQGGNQGQAPRGRKPPLGSTNSNNNNVNTASMTIPVVESQQVNNQQQDVIIDRGSMNASQIVQSPSSAQVQQQQISAPQRLPQQKKPRKIAVQRHRYKYEGRGFDIWTKNLKRPIYTSTTLRINLSFKGNEKAVKQFLQQKGGLKEQLIENVQEIDPRKSVSPRGGRGRGRNNDDRPMKKFTIVRVRCSLQKIKDCVDRIKALEEYKDDPDIIRKQNNRTRMDRNARISKKLYVNNFDILNENTHKDLTKLFLKFGDLEQDIFIGRDQRRNPYAFVVFRNVNDAKRCMDQHNQYQTTLFFPPKDKTQNNSYNSYEQSPRQSVYMNRKLGIEYNNPNNNQGGNTGNRGQGKGRQGGRRTGGGRGGGRGKGRR